MEVVVARARYNIFKCAMLIIIIIEIIIIIIIIIR